MRLTELPGRLFASTDVSNDLLKCRDEVGIETCATTHLDTSLSLYDIFDMMTTNVSRVEAMCKGLRRRLSPCIRPCFAEFSASKYGYLENVCSFVRWIRWQEECWTEQWAVEARQCYRWLYPHFRTDYPYLGLYPEPYRVYDRASIARDCFPTASRSVADKCSYYQSWVFQKILPNYYDLHGYPEEFDHVPDSFGFPGM
ncbi:hypothetical protein ElyMa_001777200 [Elysia marginata]|uniref:Uncharacterized protein n=1 Tax=Elysia marginata TaxID=1093978 RepID=A0AAV4EDA0_9GAST|nr:hypothetical protein ElyMa_001777200 [Elysia marginata]